MGNTYLGSTLIDSEVFWPFTDAARTAMVRENTVENFMIMGFWGLKTDCSRNQVFIYPQS
jgi:hypothetical protein